MWIKNGMSHYQLLFNFGLKDSLLFVLNTTATLTLTDQRRQNTRPRSVQMLDSAIHQINHYPLDSAIGFRNTYSLDSDLSSG